jgi:hypothetical protein
MKIAPKNKKFLRFQLTGEIRTVSKSGKPLKRAVRDAGDIVFTKKEVHIPKRLHVLEYFRSDGAKIIRRAMWQRAGRILKLRRMV